MNQLEDTLIYLYVKQHEITRLKYFGKTTNSNPFKYHGSGKRWYNHINKHGKKYVQTLEIYGFDNQKLCTEFALKFSKDNNIVESKEWANLIPENGFDGGVPGIAFSNEHKLKMSEASKGKIHSEETKRKIAESLKGNILTDQTKKKISQVRTGKTHSEETKRKIAEAKIGKKLAPYKKRVIEFEPA